MSSSISLDKTYRTRSGDLVRILAIDALDKEFPVIGLVKVDSDEELVGRWTSQGAHDNPNVEDPWDLIEYNPWAAVALDTPLWVRNASGGPWIKAHFRSFDAPNINCWASGRTSHTASDPTDFYSFSFASLTPPENA